MTSTEPRKSGPLDEDYGAIGSNPGISNDPDGKSSPNVSDKVVGAAAIAGGVAGLAVCGPLVAVAGAIGAGALAATQSNTAGDVARASGDVVIATGERAKKLDKKHHIVEKTKKAASNLVQKGKELDEKHHIKDKTKETAGKIAKNAKEFEEKHHLGEKAGKGLKDGLDFMSKKLKPKDSK